MTTLNSYATLAEYKAYISSRGIPVGVDATDDALVESLLKAASRYFDNGTGRNFYPLVQTRYYDVPNNDSIDVRELVLDGDLLEVISVVNGDSTTIPSTEYVARPRNFTPHLYIRLLDNSTYQWVSNGSGNYHDVIAVTGIWGFHNRYSLAWLSGSTLAEDLDTSETGVDVASGTLFEVGNVIKCGDELGYVSAVSTNTLTSTRGENGSTAATHLSGASVYIWQFMDELKTAVLETAMQAYKRRFGQSDSNTQTITAAGVVLTPRDVPAMAADFIRTFRRYS